MWDHDTYVTLYQARYAWNYPNYDLAMLLFQSRQLREMLEPFIFGVLHPNYSRKYTDEFATVRVRWWHSFKTDLSKNRRNLQKNNNILQTYPSNALFFVQFTNSRVPIWYPQGKLM